MPNVVALFSFVYVISSSFEDAFSIVCSLLEKQGHASYRTSIECAWAALRERVKEFLNKAGCVCKQEGTCNEVKGVRVFMELVKNGEMEEDVAGLLSSLFVCCKELSFQYNFMPRMTFIGEMSVDAFPNDRHAYSSWIDLCTCDAMTVCPHFGVHE